MGVYVDMHFLLSSLISCPEGWTSAFLLLPRFHLVAHPVGGGRGLKRRTVLGMMCLCKRVQQSQWTRRNNFASIRRVAQEAKSERATFVFTRLIPNALAAGRARRHLAPGEAR